MTHLATTHSRQPSQPRRRPGYTRARGFSIIEIMVGLAIGLASLLAIYQLYAVSEGRRRTAAATSEAQSAGALALFAIERDIRSAGLGFAGMDSSHFGCNVQAKAPVAAFPLVPVRIESGGTELRVLTGSSNNMFAGARYTASTPGTFTMEKSNAGFQAGDVIVGISDTPATNGNQCFLMEVTAGAGTLQAGPGGAADPQVPIAANRVDHGTTRYKNFYTDEAVDPRFNSTTISPPDGSEGALHSLGPAPNLNVWRLLGGQLKRQNLLEPQSVEVAVANDVLDFRAEYGFADDTGQINNWGLTQPADWSRVIAIRIAVLVRSSQYEKEAVTNASPRWANGEKEFDMSSISDWQHYRYRVYESVVPLRNTIWGQMQ